MTLKEYASLQQYIIENHSVSQGACVKYLDATFDYRTNTYFAVSLRGYGWQKVFHCQNENKEIELSLRDRITEFLKERARGVWRD